MTALLILAALLIFGLCFADDIDRALILFGLLIFAPFMAGGIPSGKHEGELDG